MTRKRLEVLPNDAVSGRICDARGPVLDSVKFCHRLGLNCASCSPYRVPVARLAAAQAAIEEKRKAKTAKKK